ncbi:MAG: prolipoprotein diacylglyceryl transferase [Actinomycetota bacterium]
MTAAWLPPAAMLSLPAVLASLPSPPVNEIHLGPLRLTFYGILVATGVALAWSLVRRRFAARGGSADRVDTLVGRMVVVGFLGARLAYVSTHLDRYEGEWWKVLAVWEGGLALYGGVTVGGITLWVLARRWGMDLGDLADSLAPALPLAQAVGRWGNYFNQELFGTPTSLPWGVEIAPPNRPALFPQAETFHPTFLYESLWNLALVGLILWMDATGRVRRGRLIGVYLAGYGVVRFLLELIRVDTTFRLLGLSRNGWVSIGVVAAGLVALFWDRFPAGRFPGRAG